MDATKGSQFEQSFKIFEHVAGTEPRLTPGQILLEDGHMLLRAATETERRVRQAANE